jgi:hypothetical protein
MTGYITLFINGDPLVLAIMMIATVKAMITFLAAKAHIPIKKSTITNYDVLDEHLTK